MIKSLAVITSAVITKRIKIPVQSALPVLRVRREFRDLKDFKVLWEHRDLKDYRVHAVL